MEDHQAGKLLVNSRSHSGPAQYHGRICSVGGGRTGSAMAGMEEAKTTCSLQHDPRQSWSCNEEVGVNSAKMMPNTKRGHCE